MIPDLVQDNSVPTINKLYTYIRANINNIMKDSSIQTMLDPKNNSTTRQFLERENISTDEAYTMSYLTTVILISQLSGICLDD